MRDGDVTRYGTRALANDVQAQRLNGREFVWHAVVLLVLVVVLFPTVFIHGERAVPGTLLFEWPPWNHHQPEHFRKATNDTTVEAIAQFTLWYTLTQRALKQGEWPLWNNLEFTGMPLLANGQSAVFYPLHLLHGFMNVYLAMTLYVVLKIWLCGMTAYLCARTIGLGAPASRFVSIACMLSGYNMIWCYWPLPDVNAWTPIILIGAELLLDGSFRRGFFAMAFGATLLILSGHPETAFCDGAGVGVYFFLRLVFARRCGRRLWLPIAVAGGAWLVALLVCAVQVMPLMEYIFNSHTAGFRAIHEKDSFFVTFGGLVSLWTPRFFGSTADGNFWGGSWGDPNSNFQGMVYPGVTVWLAISLLLLNKPRGTNIRRKALCLAIACLLLFLLACNVSIVAPLSRLPFLRSMRDVYYSGFTAFGFPLLAGLGVQHWLAQRRKLRELLPACTLTVAACGATFLLYVMFRDGLRTDGHDHYVLTQVVMSSGVAVAGLVALAFVCRWPHRAGIALLAVITAADLLYAARNLHPTCPPEQLFPRTPLTDLLEDVKGPIRVSTESTAIRPVTLANYGIEELWGYDGIVPARIIDFLGLAQRGNWETVEPVCAVTHYVFNDNAFTNPQDAAPRLELLSAGDGLEIYRNTYAFSRAFLVPELRVLPSAQAVLDAMCESGFNPARVAVTDAPPDCILPRHAIAELGRAELKKTSLCSVTVEVESAHECVLVLSDAYYPGWKARVNSRPTTVFPVYHNFRGVVVPEGHSEVVFEFRPWAFQLGLSISMVTLCLSTGLSLLVWRRRAKGVRPSHG